MVRRSGPAILLAFAALAPLAASCAYYNTFYLSKRYYATATAGLPYSVDKPTGAQTGNFQKAIDYAKKLLASYPNSKWVDDAYLLWAQALLGRDDPLQTVTMLQDYSARYPASPLKDDATFYLGVAQRQARKPHEALLSLDEYLGKVPEGELVPYAHFERSRALMSLNRPAEAAQAASVVIDGFPKHPLTVRVRASRAEALLAAGEPLAARQDFQALGLRSVDDAERFTFLLREADCLEAARDYAGGLALLTSALAHEPVPVKTAGGGAPTGPGADRYGQLALRIGTLHMLDGRPEQALEAYRNVIHDYPKHPLAAEAQYRIGYVHETVLDDFETASQEYAKVRDQSVGSAFYAQATLRQQSLDRLARFRSAGSDSLDRKVEAGFLLAEQYLFQLDKPDRALEAYAEIAREHPGTPAAAKAMNAQAWVLRHKLDRPAAADSLLWKVVREHPATESQLAARDYLELGGHEVPAALIKLPERRLTAADSALNLTTPPQGPTPLAAPQAPGRLLRPGEGDPIPDRREPQAGQPFPAPGPAVRPSPVAGADSMFRLPGASPPAPGIAGRGDSLAARLDSTRWTPADSARRVIPARGPMAPADSLRRAVADTARRVVAGLTRPAPVDSAARARAIRGVPGDTLRRLVAADTTARAARDTTRRAPEDTTRRRWIPTDTLRWAPR